MFLGFGEIMMRVAPPEHRRWRQVLARRPWLPAELRALPQRVLQWRVPTRCAGALPGSARPYR